MQNNIYIIKNRKGVVTIYVCLLLAFMIPLIAMIIGLARFNGMQVTSSCAADMCADSILAEYHQELLSEYGLLFVDTSYGGKYGSLDKTSEHMEDYLSYNLTPSKKLMLFGEKDLYKVRAESADVLEASRATDEEGEVFRYMAGSYMLDLVGYEYLSNIKDVISVSETVDLDGVDITQKMKEAADDVKEGIESEKGIDWEEMEIKGPLGQLDRLSKFSPLELLFMTLGSDYKISENATDISSLVSSRDNVKGNGMPKAWKKRNTLEDQLLFNEYIMLKAGNFMKQKDYGALKYQAEYVIAGKNNDKDNLSNVALRILAIRGASNTAYFMTDDDKKEQARYLAEVIALVLESPSLADALEVAIDTAWILSESILDLREIYKGNSVPLIKTDEGWKLSIDGMISGTTAMPGTIKPGEIMEIINPEEPHDSLNMYYQDYLRLLLYLTPEKERTYRMMDAVEMGIRDITGNDYFRLDNCVAYFKVRIAIISDYGYEYLYERYFGYE